MASDGLNKKAIKGKCRICQRVRCTSEHVKAVGEVRHGYATGHIWECTDTRSCEVIANQKLEALKTNGVVKSRIEIALKEGNYKTYKIYH